MEILDKTGPPFLLVDDVVEDDLLNFTLEEGFKGDSYSSSSSKPNETATFTLETGSFPECVEEDLEWLSNKDAFPAVETCFGILADNPDLVLSHQSPISVLENSSSSSNNTNGNGSSTGVSCCGTFTVPTKYPMRARSKRRRRKRRAGFPVLLGQHDLVNIKIKQESSFLFPPLSSVVKSGGVSLGRRCLHCQTDTTPQWRAGPMGPKTLCNACGVRYKSGRLLPEYRPANSPTFSSVLHSNSHKKVVEMRKRKQVGTRGGIVFSEGCGYRVGE